MIFRVENLGPLREAEVDLSKSLIVLTGPNNSGKTYLAWSVYGLHRFSPRANDVCWRWARALVTSPDHAIDLEELFQEDGKELCEAVVANFLPHLHACFAAEASQFAGARLALVPTGNFYDLAKIPAYSSVTFHLAAGERRRFTLTLHPGTSSSRARLHLSVLDAATDVPAGDEPPPTPTVDAAAEEHSRVESDIQCTNKLITPSVYRALLSTCIAFPAERIAVDIFSKELEINRSELVDQIMELNPQTTDEAPAELLRTKTGRYGWPVRDSIRVANDLKNISKVTGRFSDLAEELEKTVLGGKISVSRYGGMVFSPFTAPEQQLAIHLSASVVKSLASLVFYLRHLAGKGDFLIIDEPEQNLHPDNQRKVTQILAKAVRRGFKIMMSTHSDYIVRELDHLIMLSKLSAEEVAELGYDPACALAPEQVGVYLFNDNTAHIVAVEETGFSVATIDAEDKKLNETSQRLYGKLWGE